MNIQLLSQTEKFEEYRHWLQTELPFTTCSLSNQIEPNQDIILLFPEQFQSNTWRQIVEESKERTWYIFLEENLTENERCQLLNEGVDLIWPFHLSPRELLARLKAILRLIENYQLPEALHYNGEELVLQTNTQQVYVEGKEVLLTASEYQLLLQFMQHPNRIYSRDELLVLLNNQRGMHRAIDTHIKNLRRKIELSNRSFDYIKTVHGRGYRFQYQEE
ncbi:response regulator transcription factor [Enterococcus saccharolyticus]|uniref:Transcriptional regulator n=1 Tax=Candidatus Enterococcus willemsii TaxID=1857215 RepID=A0ABQ6YYT7_9ENTE|nr:MULTISPECIES: response regulator transcription factor [Enterococcus]KAF1303304.1 transcriptional regulator [Enterococcus sp. CU12B]MCD5001728.1 response regulator transcription factor [Enterococcus saccharolyticus]